jgi:hypothetical protein
MRRLCSAVIGLPTLLMNPIPMTSNGDGWIPVQGRTVGILHYATKEKLLSTKY